MGQLRMIWAALLAGEVMFLLVAVVMVRSGNGPTSPEVGRLLSLISVVALAAEVPLGLVLRSMIHNKGRQNGAVALSAYSTGNIVFWAMLEGVAFLGTLAVLLGGRIDWIIAVPLIAMVIQLATFPTGESVKSR